MNRTPNSRNRIIKHSLLAATMGLLFVGQPAMAATINWNTGTGNWNVGTNWTGAVVPIAGDDVRMNNGGLLNITDSQAAKNVHVGYTVAGDNRMVISSSGTLTTTALSRIGFSTSTQGTVTVDGVWTGGGGLYLGGGGSGDMMIHSGGNVTNGALSIGVSSVASGTLTIDSGGSMNMSSVSIAHAAGGQGDVFVSGTLTDTGFLTVGTGGTGTLTVETGGVVTSVGTTTMGSTTTGTGSVLVHGTLSNTTGMILGKAGSGSGMLTIGAGGVVNVNSGAGIVSLGQGISVGSGVVNIGGVVNGSTPGTAESAGVLNASEVRGFTNVGAGSTLNFNHTSTDYYFTNTGLSGGTSILISGAPTTLNHYSGKTTLNGANTYGGGTTVKGGTLVAGNDTALGSAAATVESGTLEVATAVDVANDVTINAGTLLVNGTASGAVSFGASGGTLGGGGTVSGAVALNNVNQVLSPGNSPGILSFDAAQTWDSYTYLWEVNDWTSSVAGTNFDQVAITGALDLSGAGTDDIVLDITSLTAGNVAGDVPNFAETDNQWIILTTSGGVTGFDDADWSVLTANFSSSPVAGGTWSVSQVGNDIVLSYTAIPEPTVTTLILAGASLGFLSMGRKRRR